MLTNISNNIQRTIKIEQVTAQNDEPPAVYVMEELSEMCKQNIEAAQFISQSLSKKLSSRSALVIIKALRVIKYIAGKGNQNFVRVIQREATIIRELQTYRGEVDPLRGEKPNQRVRELAKEVLPIIYNPPAPTSTNNQLSLQGKIQGFGNQHSMDLKQINTQSTFNFGGFNRADSNNNASRNSGSFSRNGPSNMSWNQMGLQGNIMNQFQGGPTQHSYRQLSLQSQDSAFASSVQYSSVEERIVGEICSVHNAKSIPLDNDIVNFLEYLANCSGRKVGNLLNQKLKDPLMQVQFKAIYVLEKVVEMANSQACQDVCQYIMENPANVRSLSLNEHKKIRSRAKKLKLYLLGEEDLNPEEVEQEAEAQEKITATDTTATKEEPTKPTKEDAYQLDLLGDLLGDEPARPPQAKPQPQSKADDLLGELQNPVTPNRKPTPQNTYNPTSVFSQQSPITPPQQAQSPQVQPQPPSSTVDDLFSGLTLTSRPINYSQGGGIQQPSSATNPQTKSFDSHLQPDSTPTPAQTASSNVQQEIANINGSLSPLQQKQQGIYQTTSLGKQVQNQKVAPTGKQLADQALQNFGAFDQLKPMGGGAGLQNSMQGQGQQQNQYQYTYPGISSNNNQQQSMGGGFGFQPQGQQQKANTGAFGDFGKPMNQNWGQGQMKQQQPTPASFAQPGSDKNFAAFDFISDELNKNKIK